MSCDRQFCGFLAVPLVGLQCVIVVFSGHTHSHFWLMQEEERAGHTCVMKMAQLQYGKSVCPYHEELLLKERVSSWRE